MTNGGRKLSGIIKELTKHTDYLAPSLLVSATYEGEPKVAVLKLYELQSQRIYFWYDDTGHKPYCYSKLPPGELKEIEGRPDILELKAEKRRDLLHDQTVPVTKIIAADPLAIGGSPSEKSVRNVIEAWEADIKYYENYLYDRGLLPCAFYEIRDSLAVRFSHGLPGEVKRRLERILQQSQPEFREHIMEWAELLSQPLPPIRRASIDIEVYTPEENRIPDPREAQHPIMAVALVGSDDRREVHLLRRKGVEEGRRELDESIQLVFYDSETVLIERVFERILEYPFIVTFNGDDFDLDYLYHRALKLGFSRDEVPITLGNNWAYVKHGVHIDLYKTFMNRSLQVYAFNNRYSEHTLNGVSEPLIGEAKIEFDGPLTSLPLHELARYCYNDARITYKLTSFNDDLLMKLLLVIARVAKMPVDDASRLAVSNWIRSMMYFEHRRINALIPRKEELEEKEGAYSVAVTKGKKYKGALVVEPTAGVHFNVSVLDFASLYPSIIKVHNLSYETVRCLHEECRSNLIPGTEHWVCTKRRGIASLIIGSLRDLRVNYYKPLARQPDLNKEQRTLYNVVSQALKVILNASYGVMGAEPFPLYCLAVADATAALGRHVITKTIEQCKALGIDVVYGDTDSLFLKSPRKEQVEAITKWADRDLGIELDLEKDYRYVAFSQRKKNYMGVLPDGSVDIKGLTGKKSHTPPMIRRAFYDSVEILSRVKSRDEFERAREEIRGYIREKYLALRQRRIPVEELAFNVMISKSPERYVDTTPQHVKAAMLLKGQGREVKAGDIISFVKTITPPGVKPVSVAKVDEIDTEKYLDYLRGTFDQLLDALGYEFDEILGATKLEDFFWGA